MTKPRIKKLTSHAEFDQCVEIQKKVWKHRDEDLTPAHQFCIGQETGSILLGAFLGGALAGFVYSFPAVSRGKLCQHSHLLAVLPQFQGYGVGKVLKWAQREEALRQGYDLITWTFDPLQVRNANLNLHTLGAVARAYLPNFYGLTPSLLIAPRVPSDRLKVEWVLKDRRLERRQRKEWEAYDVEKLPKALEGREAAGVRRPGPVRRLPAAPVVLAEIPGRIRDYRGTPELLAEWQSALRRALTQHFALGFRAADFILGERSFYVLEKMKAGNP
jgi:predicted GNAT superfamily acetyltransferase